MAFARHFGERGGRTELALLEEAKGRETDEFVLNQIDKAITAIKGRLASGKEDAGEAGEP